MEQVEILRFTGFYPRMNDMPACLGILGNGLAVLTEKLKIGGCRNKLTESHKQILHYII